MKRCHIVLGVLALLAVGCGRTPTATPEQRAAMGPEIAARLKSRPPRLNLDVKVEITGARSEHLKIVSPYVGPPTIETLAYRGIFADFCHAGFQDVEVADGLGWSKLWKC
jgi:hypothetical protein